MRKNVKAIILIFIILASTAISLAIILPYFKPTTQQNRGLVNIYVDSKIYDTLYNELAQYKQDIIDQGYSAEIIKWSSTNVTLLKANISNAYQLGLIGVILIGEIPYAMARHWDSNWGKYWNYPCDLFLMDLDGVWNDGVITNGIYDIDNNEHMSGSGDWTPEIWLARINPTSIVIPGFNYSDAYKKFFDRDYKLRHGLTYRPHKSLLYIDDDWSSYKDEWLSNFTAYTGTEVNCYWNNPTTTSTNYMNNITMVNYEFVHILVHSWPTQHMFGPPYALGSEGVTTYKNIYGNNTLPLFYNLYACFSCNYTQADNTGTYYLFTSNNTLTVIGSARDGGMDLYQPFYDALKEGKPIGEAFRIWFHNPEIVNYNKELLYYGMTILGDPLLTIYMT
ncbi:MAG: hypothetical protein ACFFFB_22105 [Candidatus Heimdallarchaeota archaeon]